MPEHRRQLTDQQRAQRRAQDREYARHGRLAAPQLRWMERLADRPREFQELQPR